MLLFHFFDSHKPLKALKNKGFLEKVRVPFSAFGIVKFNKNPVKSRLFRVLILLFYAILYSVLLLFCSLILCYFIYRRNSSLQRLNWRVFSTKSGIGRLLCRELLRNRLDLLWFLYQIAKAGKSPLPSPRDTVLFGIRVVLHNLLEFDSKP